MVETRKEQVHLVRSLQQLEAELLSLMLPSLAAGKEAAASVSRSTESSEPSSQKISAKSKKKTVGFP